MNPFTLMPGSLAVDVAPIEDWESHAKQIFDMQKYVPWWLGDMVVFGEAQFGDDFWQIPPEGVSEDMLSRFAGVARKYPVSERILGVSWSHHVTALKISNSKLRRALLKIAESERLTSEEFRDYVRNFLKSRTEQDF